MAIAIGFQVSKRFKYPFYPPDLCSEIKPVKHIKPLKVGLVLSVLFYRNRHHQYQYWFYDLSPDPNYPNNRL